MATRTPPRRGPKRPMSGAGKSMLGRVAGNAKRGWKKTVRKHPMVGVVTSIVLAIVAVVSLLLGVILESALYYLVMAMSGLGALAIRRAQQMARERPGGASRPRPTSGGPRKPPPPPPPSPGADPPPPSGPLRCTATGRPASECDCASRHVISSEGARRYGVPLGSPIGRRKREARPPRAL